MTSSGLPWPTSVTQRSAASSTGSSSAASTSADALVGERVELEAPRAGVLPQRDDGVESGWPARTLGEHEGDARAGEMQHEGAETESSRWASSTASTTGRPAARSLSARALRRISGRWMTSSVRASSGTSRVRPRAGPRRRYGWPGPIRRAAARSAGLRLRASRVFPTPASATSTTPWHSRSARAPAICASPVPARSGATPSAQTNQRTGVESTRCWSMPAPGRPRGRSWRSRLGPSARISVPPASMPSQSARRRPRPGRPCPPGRRRRPCRCPCSRRAGRRRGCRCGASSWRTTSVIAHAAAFAAL